MPMQGILKLMTIFLGANDASTDPNAGQFVPIDRFKQNLVAIINHESVRAHSPKIILITPPPVEETILLETVKGFGGSEQPRKQRVTKKYATAVCEVGKQTGVAVLDIWKDFMFKAGWIEGDDTMPGSEENGKSIALMDLLYDGLHLSPAGYEAVFLSLMALIEANWPELSPERMPFAVRCDWEKGKTVQSSDERIT
ncbi:hypothetical protein BP5796_13077 [Coleophoma crateriformis]|uniref:SGNH hydrolase-type esterase domain-containing protein n=1 Tax=Coleophoma crateriformis TaxID=565419 RepID=A0A3D8Q458_9HELO|nr:hypothetical protein BP5796_13077 [Coleophoma crateriformis]